MTLEVKISRPLLPDLRRWFILAALVSLPVAACSAERKEYDHSADDLAHARDRWEASNLSNYSVTLVFWNILGGTSECSVAVANGKARVLGADGPMHDECERLAVVENMFDYVEGSLGGEGINYAEFDNENGHVILAREAWDGCSTDSCSEILVRLFPD